ncbi:MAG: sugar phosphate isomerase/epimerase [Chitinophagaceae bacterium]|nr:sugar phosphate isomerase/epimerase [Chitinophagaceae bacterium]
MAGLAPLVPALEPIETIADPKYKGKNKVGFNLLLFTSSISEKMNPVADRLKQIGFDGIEVSMGNPEEKPYVEYGKYLKSIGMDATCSFGLGPDHDPINESPAVREAALERMKWMIDRANDLGAKLMCGPMHSAFLNFRKRPPSEDEYKWSAEVLHKAGDYAAKSGVVFAVEAINRFECYLCNTIDQLNKLVKLTNHPNIKPMYDTFHSNIEDKSLTSAIASLKGSLAHVHISENDRGAPGSGHINFDSVFAELSKINYSGWITIESFSRNDPGFANMMNVWREFSPTWDVPSKGLAMIKKFQARFKV